MPWWALRRLVKELHGIEKELRRATRIWNGCAQLRKSAEESRPEKALLCEEMIGKGSTIQRRVEGI